MNIETKQIVFELMQYRRSSIDATSWFEGVGHNERLCPLLQRKWDNVFEAFEKYRQITYDIQGMWDKGTDVLIRTEEDGTSGFICFQVKTETDLHDREWLQKLKAQCVDTKLKYDALVDYYVVVCCHSGEKKNKDKIRHVEAELSKLKDVHVVEPEHAVTFYRLSCMHIDAMIKSRFGAEDPVFREGLGLIAELTPIDRTILFQLIWESEYRGLREVPLGNILDASFVRQMLRAVPDYPRRWFEADEEDVEDMGDVPHGEEKWEDLGRDDFDRVTETMQYLDGDFVELVDGEKVRVWRNDVRPLLALMIDGQIRYGHERDDLLAYMLDLLGPVRGYAGSESGIEEG